MLTFTLNINIKLPLFWSTLSRAGGLDLAISVGLAHGLCVLLLKGLGHCFPLNCWKYWKKIGQPRDIPTLIPQDDSYMNSYMNSWCLRIHISIYALEFMIMKSYMNLYHKFIKLKSIWLNSSSWNQSGFCLECVSVSEIIYSSKEIMNHSLQSADSAHCQAVPALRLLCTVCSSCSEATGTCTAVIVSLRLMPLISPSQLEGFYS